jgi:hypothetical protein
MTPNDSHSAAGRKQVSSGLKTKSFPPRIAPAKPNAPTPPFSKMILSGILSKNHCFLEARVESPAFHGLLAALAG